MQEITEESLTHLPTRVSYLRSFINFTNEDSAALHASKPILGPLVPDVVDLVYTKLLEYSITAKAFVPRQTGYTGSAPADLKDLSLEHPQIAFRKDFLKGYIVKLVSMDYEDEKSWEYLDKVGRMHTGVEDSGFKHRSKRPGLRVEYIHCAILLGFVEDIILSTVIAHPDLDTETKLAVSKAVNKILWIQNDLFARHYIEQTEQAQAAKERARPFHCNSAFGAAVPFVACLIGFALARFWKH
ncbi:Protoglobin-domain-containing protein [Cyathus striatus]|nr:Protoglobin-domain-containing protein [Cyathus striatus]